jgi:peroxiredoxin
LGTLARTTIGDTRRGFAGHDFFEVLMRSKLSLFLAVILAVCLAAAAGWAGKAPDFSLPDPNGKKIRLSDQRGKLVVLEFLQTGCPACQRAGRTLQKLYSENHQRDLMVIGISHDRRGMQAIRKYVQQHGLTYPVVLGDLTVAVNYLGSTRRRPRFHVPVFFFVGPDGQLLEERKSGRTADRNWFAEMEQNLEATVRRLLAAQQTPVRQARVRERKAAGRKPLEPK